MSSVNGDWRCGARLMMIKGCADEASEGIIHCPGSTECVDRHNEIDAPSEIGLHAASQGDPRATGLNLLWKRLAASHARHGRGWVQLSPTTAFDLHSWSPRIRPHATRTPPSGPLEAVKLWASNLWSVL